jgi:hypothetical protein
MSELECNVIRESVVVGLEYARAICTKTGRAVGRRGLYSIGRPFGGCALPRAQ